MTVRIHRNIAWSYANWASSIVVPLVMIPIYLRCLGGQTYGAWLIILSITGYMNLANLGMGQTLNNRIAEAVACDRHGEIGPLVSTTFFGYAAIAAILTLVLTAGTPLIAGRLTAGATGAVVAPFLVYIALVMLSFPFKVFPMVLRGFERVDQDQAIITVSNLLRMIVLAAALFSGFKLMAVATINGIAEILTPLAQYWLSRRLVRDLRPRFSKFSRRLLMDMIRPSAGFFGIQVSNTLITGVDNIVIGYALGAAAVTAYAVPFRIITMLVGLLSVAVNAVNPTVTVSFAQGTRHSLGRGYLFSLRVSTLYGTVGAIALWIAGPAFLRVWAGSEVFPGYVAYTLMVAMFTMTILIMPASSVLWATTRHYTWAMMSLCEGALNLGLSLFLVQRFGLSGVIAATVAASLMLTFWYLPYAALRTLEVSILSALRELAPGFVVSGITLATVAVLWNPHSNSSLLHALVWTAIACLAYSASFAWIGFSRAQRQTALGWLIASRCGQPPMSSDAAETAIAKVGVGSP